VAAISEITNGRMDANIKLRITSPLERTKKDISAREQRTATAFVRVPENYGLRFGEDRYSVATEDLPIAASCAPNSARPTDLGRIKVAKGPRASNR